MRPAKIARKRLKGHWKAALLVQGTILAAGGLLTALEAGALLLGGLGLEQMLHIEDAVSSPALWMRLGLMLAAVLLDLLLTSPLRLGQAAFYDGLARGEPTSAKEPWRFFSRGRYGRALRWRLSLWGLRVAWGLLLFAPGALILGYGEVIRRSGENTPFADMTILFTGLFGLFAILAGFVALELVMLRYMPAQYLLRRERKVKTALRESRFMMKGRTGEIAWLILGFAGWLATCLALFPYFYASPLFMTTRAGAAAELPRPAPAPRTAAGRVIVPPGQRTGPSLPATRVMEAVRLPDRRVPREG